MFLKNVYNDDQTYVQKYRALNHHCLTYTLACLKLPPLATNKQSDISQRLYT